jgi:hypothetical protein
MGKPTDPCRRLVTVAACRQVATILLRNGTVRSGDFVVAGEAFAKVKSLVNDANKSRARDELDGGVNGGVDGGGWCS